MLRRTATIDELLESPRSERRDVLEDLVVDQFKTLLLMPEDEQLPIQDSFFDLGLTSLLVNEAKVRLEELLGCAISANVLFNSPTVERLVDYLYDEVLAEVLEPAA